METVLVVGGAFGLILGLAAVIGDWLEFRKRAKLRHAVSYCDEKALLNIITPVGRMLAARATRERQAQQSNHTHRRAA